MEISIISKRENELFSREEIEFEIKFSGVTPSRKEITAGIAQKIGIKPELVSVKNIVQNFGKKEIKVSVRVYKTQEQLKRLEFAYIAERNLGKKPKEGDASAEKK